MDATEAIKDAANAIIGSRDFCGNERQAALDAFADFGIRPTNEMLSQAFTMANTEWRASQQAAGVPKKYWRY